MLLIVKKKRMTDLEKTVEVLSERVTELSTAVDSLTQARKNDRDTRATLATTMNEWVYGKAGGEDDGE